MNRQVFFRDLARVRTAAVYSVGMKILATIAGFAVTTLLTRSLLPEDMGYYYIIFSIVSVGAIFSQYGLDRTAIRILSSSVALGDLVKSNSAVIAVLLVWLLTATITSVLVLAVIGFGVFEKFDAIQQFYIFIVLWVVGQSLETVVASLFRAKHQVVRALIFAGLLRNTLLFFGLLILLYDQQQQILTLGTVTWCCMAVSLVVSLAGLFTFLKGVDYSSVSLNLDLLRDVSSSSWPVMVHAFLLYVVNQANLLLLGVYSTPEQVALYGTALRLVLLVGIASSILNIVITPLIAERHATGTLKEIEGLIRSAAALCGMPAFIVLVAYLLFSDEILLLLFGEYYVKASTILIVLSLAEVVRVATGPCSIALNMTNNQLYLMKISIVRAVLSVTIGIVIAPIWGALGIAILYTILVFGNDFISLLLAKRKLGILTLVGFSDIPLFLQRVKAR